MSSPVNRLINSCHKLTALTLNEVFVVSEIKMLWAFLKIDVCIENASSTYVLKIYIKTYFLWLTKVVMFSWRVFISVWCVSLVSLSSCSLWDTSCWSCSFKRATFSFSSARWFCNSSSLLCDDKRRGGCAVSSGINYKLRGLKQKKNKYPTLSE